MPFFLRIDRKIISTHFSCDLNACKGACCTFPGGSGPPVLEEELPLLEQAWKAVRDIIPAAHAQEGDRHGIIVHDGEELTIHCLDERACVFVMYEGDVAKCSIQYLHMLGRLSWPKPQSCHLFPLRIRGRRRDQLRFESFSECAPAHAAGEERNMLLVRFLRGAITRVFGSSFYRELDDRSTQILCRGEGD